MEKSFPLVSVIVLNYNGKQYLDMCLSSVFKTEYPNFEVIFVDNGSCDNSSAFVKQRYGRNEKLKIVTLKKNLGFAEGNNCGSLWVDRNARYVVFLNNDTKVDREWLGKLVSIMEKSQRIGVAQAKILSLNDPEIIDCAGGFINRIGLVHERGHGEKDTNQYSDVDEILYAKGAAMIVRRQLWSTLRGFDPAYFLFWEDTDFCWRARLAGYKVVLVPDSVVYHVSSATAKEYLNASTQFYDIRNRIMTLTSNYNSHNLYKYLPLLLIYHGVCVLTWDLCKMKSSSLVFHKIRGLFWVLTHFSYLLHKREIVQKRIRKISDKDAIGHLILRGTLKLGG